jgi:hypothetical protein
MSQTNRKGKFESMMGIYAIKNKANRKVYIGQSIHIQNRFKQHLAALEKGNHHSKKLQKDFDKYGPEQFTLEILEICNRDELDQKEIEWINKFDSLQNGYNVQDPRDRKAGWFKREKTPVITVWGELRRTFQDFLLTSAEDFKNWMVENRKEIQKVLVIFALIIGLFGLITLLIIINDLLTMAIPNFEKSSYGLILFFASFVTVVFYLFIAVQTVIKNKWINW